MKRIIFSLMTLVAVLTVSGAGSLAYFSDTETSTGNTFTAGTLDLKVWDYPGESWVDDPNVPVLISSGYWNSAIGSIINNLKPGDEGTITVPIRNDGSVDGVAKLQLTNLVDYENGVNEPECVAEGGSWIGGVCTACATGCGDPGPGEGELSQYLDVVVYYGAVEVADGTLYDLVVGGVIDLGALAAYAEEDVVMVFSIDYLTAGNIIQSDSVDFDITFELIQPEP